MKPLMAVVLLSTIALITDCVRHQPAKTMVHTYRFNRCTHNGDHEICECDYPHQELNAKTGEPYIVCD